MSEHDWLLAARYTARVGFPLFLAFYVTRQRRPWLLAFAATHTVHLVALTIYLMVSGEHRSATTLAVGGAGYGCLYLMAVGAGGPSVERGGGRVLAAVGPNLLAFIFGASYLGRAFDPDRRVVGIIGMSMLVAALIGRLQWRRRRPPVAIADVWVSRPPAPWRGSPP